MTKIRMTLALAIAVAMLGGSLLGCTSVTGEPSKITELELGDCVNRPPASNQERPTKASCSDGSYEVVVQAAATGDEHPGDNYEDLIRVCAAKGGNWWFPPTKDGWDEGERNVTCFAKVGG